MSKTPPIPPDQRAKVDGKPEPDDIRKPRPGEDDFDGDARGREQNLRQNTTHAGNVQDR